MPGEQDLKDELVKLKTRGDEILKELESIKKKDPVINGKPNLDNYLRSLEFLDNAQLELYGVGCDDAHYYVGLHFYEESVDDSYERVIFIQELNVTVTYSSSKWTKYEYFGVSADNLKSLLAAVSEHCKLKIPNELKRDLLTLKEYGLL